MKRNQTRLVVRFTGHVQGVGFRMTCLSQARGLDIHGHVSNQPDGSVVMDIDASTLQGKELIRRVHEARRENIDEINVTTSASLGRLTGFHVK